MTYYYWLNFFIKDIDHILGRVKVSLKKYVPGTQYSEEDLVVSDIISISNENP